MKPIFLILFFVIYIQQTNAPYSSQCNCEAIVNIDFKGNIAILDKPNGTIVKKMKHNFAEEDFLMLKIYKDSANHFYGKAFYALSPENSKTGWIQKSKEIGTYSRNYSDTLKLYSKPNLKTKIQSKSPEWINQFFPIPKCNGKWVYVKINYKGQPKEGWLQPNKQCPNPYTTCN